MALNHVAQLSKPTIMGGADRILYLLITLMPDGIVQVVTERGLKIVADISGSMAWEADSGNRKIDELKEALENSIRSLPDTDMVSVYTFDDSGEHPFGTSSLALKRQEAINVIRGLTTGGSTAISPALGPAMQSLPGTGVWRIVLVTDGDITVSNKAAEQRRCFALAGGANAAPIWVLAIGRDYDAMFLSELVAHGKPGSFYTHARDAGELSAFFADYVNRLVSSGSITDVEFSLAALNGATIEKAWRLVPDQKELVIDQGMRTDYDMDTLDCYGQQILLRLKVPTQTLGMGTFPIADYTVAYKDPDRQRVSETIDLTITNIEADAAEINPQVMATMFTVQGTIMATSGRTDDARTMFTRADNTMPGAGAEALNTLRALSSGDENERRAANTTLQQHATRFRPISS